MASPKLVQPMPPLSVEALDALREDIAERGILSPIVVDQSGRILDGHNRSAIASELGIECPSVVLQVADDAEAMDAAVALNCARRHLTREQQRAVIRAEVARRPDESDRSIARRVGCSPSTVGSVRREALGESVVSNLDTSQAENLTGNLSEVLGSVRDALSSVVTFGLSNGIPAMDLAGALFRGRRSLAGIEEMIAAYLYDDLIDDVLRPDTVALFADEHAGPEFKPLTEVEVSEVLRACAGDLREEVLQ